MIRLCRLDVARRSRGQGVSVGGGVNHPFLLSAKRPRQHRPVAVPEGGFVHIEFIRVDCALDDVLAEPIGPGDEHHVAEARLRVEREGDAARSLVGAHHLHDTDRQRNLEVIEAIVDPVGNRTVGEQRREAAAANLDDGLRSANVEKALVLAGKTRRRQIFCRSRTADGNRDIRAVLGFKLAAGRLDRAA
jgi:hypothetical protein